MKFISSNNLVNYINQNIDEAEIFSKYLEIPITEIYKCINNRSYRVHNTLRDDNKPSMGFQYLKVNGKFKLWAKDFANPFYTGDCYQIVGIKYGLSCNVGRDFVNICKIIIKDFKENRPNAVTRSIVPKVIKKDSAATVSSIDIEKREWRKSDIIYWSKFGILPQTLVSENIYPVNKFWINDLLQDYLYQPSNPAYAYYLGNKRNKVLWEVYRPYEDKVYKFRTNNFTDIKELYTVMPTENLILTKSKKDKMLIIQLLKELGVTNTQVLYTSESTRLKSHTLTLINHNYNNKFINFDLDNAGINSMKYFKEKYNFFIFPFVVDNISSIKNYPKDITDFCYRFGYESTKQMFNYLYETYIL